MPKLPRAPTAAKQASPPPARGDSLTGPGARAKASPKASPQRQRVAVGGAAAKAAASPPQRHSATRSRSPPKKALHGRSQPAATASRPGGAWAAPMVRKASAAHAPTARVQGSPKQMRAPQVTRLQRLQGPTQDLAVAALALQAPPLPHTLCRVVALSPAASTASLGETPNRGASAAALPVLLGHAAEEGALPWEDSPTSWLRPQSPQATLASTPQSEGCSWYEGASDHAAAAACQLGDGQHLPGDLAHLPLQEIFAKLAGLQALIPPHKGAPDRGEHLPPTPRLSAPAVEEPLLTATRLGLELVARSRRLEATLAELQKSCSTAAQAEQAAGETDRTAEESLPMQAALVSAKLPVPEVSPWREGAHPIASDLENLEARLAAVQSEANDLRQENAQLRAERGAAAVVEGSQDAAIRWMQNQLDHERRAHAQQLEVLARELQEQRQQLAIAVSQRMAISGRISLGAASVDSRGPDCHTGSIAVQHMSSLGGASIFCPSVHSSPPMDYRHVQPLLGAVARSQSLPPLQPQSPLDPTCQSRPRSRSSTPAQSPSLDQRQLPASPRIAAALCEHLQRSRPQVSDVRSCLLHPEPIASNIPRMVSAPGGITSGLAHATHSPQRHNVSVGSLLSCGGTLGSGGSARQFSPVRVIQSCVTVPEQQLLVVAPARSAAPSPPPQAREPIASRWPRTAVFAPPPSAATPVAAVSSQTRAMPAVVSCRPWAVSVVGADDGAAQVITDFS